MAKNFKSLEQLEQEFVNAKRALVENPNPATTRLFVQANKALEKAKERHVHKLERLPLDNQVNLF